MMEIDYSVPPGVRLLEAVSEESETSSIMSASSASVHSISLNSPPESPKEQGTDEEDDGSRKGAPTPPPKGQKSNAEVPKEEAEPVPSGERKSSWRDWLGIGGGGTVDGADTMEELADPEAPPSPAISDTPSTPGGAGPFPYSFLQDPTPSRDSTSSMLVHDGQSSTTSVHSRPRKKQYLLTVVPALNLSTDSPRLKKRAVSRRGSLVPLHSTLHAQLVAIAHEYRLPSTDDLALYLLSTPDSIKSQIPTDDGPRIGEAAWKVLWEELFEDDEQRGRDESFSSTTSDDYASPAAPATPSQSHGLFGSYSFFANSPQPQAQLPPTHRRGKSTPNSSPFLDGTRLSRIPSRRASDADDGGFGAAIVVGRVEFDFEMRGEEEERGTPVEQPPQFEPMGFPQVERRRSSGTSSSDGGKKVQRDWAKRRGSTKPVMRSEAEQNEILTPAVEAPPMPSPPRWSPAVSRGLFSPPPEPRRGGSSSRASPGTSRATLRSPPTSTTALPPHVTSALSPITDSPNASTVGDSGAYTPLGGSKENESPSLSSLASSFGERRPSVSVNLASFLGNVKLEMDEIEKLADSPPAKEQEVGLGVFSVAEVEEEEEDTAERPVSSAGSALELVDTLDALQQALGFEHERRPSHATTDTTFSEAETTSTNRSPVLRSNLGHNRSHSSPQPPSTSLFAIQEFPEAAPSRTARIPRKNAPRVDAVAGEGFTSDPHRWSTVSPRNSAYGLTPSRPAPAPPLPSQVAPVATPRAPSPPQPASASHTPLLGWFSLDHGRPKMSDLAASAEDTPKATPSSTPSMWSAFPKFGGLFGGGSRARTDEGSPEVLAAASPIPSSSDSPSLEDVPMPGKTPHRRSNSLSKRFANIRSNHTTPPDAPPLPSTTTTTNSHTSSRSGGRHSPASSRSSSTASASSVMLSANAIQAVTNSAVPSRRGSNTSALGYEGKPQHRAVGSIGSLRGDVGAGRPRFEVDLRSAQEAEQPKRKELSKDVLRAMI